MEELVWRKGEERCERSYKNDKNATTIQNKQPTEKKELYEDRPAILEGFRQISSKREDANIKMSERYMVGQATQNPFMTNSNFINDLETQLNFLMPQKS